MAPLSAGAIVVVVLLLAALIAVARFGPETAAGRRFMEHRLTGLEVGVLGQLTVDGLQGDPWKTFSARRVAIADRRGVWLEARDVTVAWSASDLLSRRARITDARARLITVLRRPELKISPHRPKPSPVSIRVDRLSARLELAPPFAGRRGLYDTGVSVDIGRSGGIKGAVTAISALHLGDHVRARFGLTRDKHFSLAADVREGAGGALAGSLGLALDKPFFLSARGGGSLSAGQFAIETRVGAQAPMVAHGRWTPLGGSGVATVQLSESNLLAPWAAKVGPVARLEGQGRKAGAGLFDVSLSLRADNLVLDAKGRANIAKLTTGPDGLAIVVRIPDPRRLVASAQLGPATLKAGLGGDSRRWVLAGAATVERPAIGGYGLSRLSGPIRIEGRGGDLAVQASGAGEGGSGAGLAAALLGARPRGSVNLILAKGGRLLIRKASLDGAGVSLTATGDQGLLGGLRLAGQAIFTNLAMAHAGARGIATTSWTASQGRPDQPWRFSLDARGRGLATGFAEADRLLGGAPHLTVRGAYSGGGLDVETAALEGAAASASAAGKVAAGGGLGLKLSWNARGPLALGPLEIDGAAKGSGDIGGTVTAPKADLLADFSRFDLPGLPLSNAHLVLSFARTAAGGDGHLTLVATSDYGPARASGAFAFARGGLDLTGVDVSAGGATAAGSLALRQGAPSSADLTVAAGPGAFLVRGHARGRLKIIGDGSAARADITVAASNVLVRQGGLVLDRLQLSAAGPLSRLPYRASAQGIAGGIPWRLAGQGEISPSGADRALSFAGSGRVSGADVRTLAPVEARLVPGGATARAALAVGAGRAELDYASHAGAASVKASATGLALSLFNPDLVGDLGMTLALSGQGPHLTGEMRAKLSGAGGRDLREAPPVDGVIDGRLGPTNLVLDAHLASRGLKADGQLTLPSEASAAPFRIAVDSHRSITGRFAIDGELEPLWDLAFGGAQTLSGRLSTAGTLGGTLADPRAIGTAALDNGRFRDADTGLKLEGVTLRATLADNSVDVGQFKATDGAKGTVSGSGRASLAREGASSFRVDLTGFRLLDNDIAKANASGQLTVDRAETGKVRLSGLLTIDRAQISPNPPVATGVVPMAVTEIHRFRDPDAKLATAPPAREAPLGLDVAIKAPGGVFVKGRGLDLELALNAHVGGTTATPKLTGTARVTRGDYDFGGKRFRIDDRGVVYLGSTAEDIRLDLTARRDDPALTALIRITGTAAKPVITLSSLPVLPQDEILSQVLFGASAAQLSALDAAQLASALVSLSGGGGFDVIGGLRNFAHLDRLSIGGDAVTGTTVSGGKYITDNIYLEITGGGREGQTATLEWRVKKALSAVAKLGTQGDSQVSVRWRKDY